MRRAVIAPTILRPPLNTSEPDHGATRLAPKALKAQPAPLTQPPDFSEGETRILPHGRTKEPPVGSLHTAPTEISPQTAPKEPLAAPRKPPQIPALPQVKDRLSVIGYFASNRKEKGASSNAAPETPKYRVREELGAGGMGKVYNVWDSDLDRRLAMKTLLPTFTGNADLIGRFIEEARETGRLEHPNIVPVHDIGVTAEGQPYFTMKYVEGRTLAEVISELGSGPEEAAASVTFTRRLHIMLQICDAIEFAHRQGVIHRDLKPANIMVGPFGEVMVMDWGLAKRIGQAEKSISMVETALSPGALRRDHTEIGAIMGTPAYMSPEQACGQVDALDARSDVYALGAVMYELFSLRQAHPGKDLTQILKAVLSATPEAPEHIKTPHHGRVPREISLIILKALEKNPEDRYQSVKELKRAIQDYLEGNAPVVCPHTFVKHSLFRLGYWVDNYPKPVILGLIFGAGVPAVVGLVRIAEWGWFLLGG